MLRLFLIALVVSIGCETIVLYLAHLPWRRPAFSRFTATRIAIAGLVCTGTTLPFVWFVFPRLIESVPWYYVTAEGFAVAVESVIIAFLLVTGWPRALALSLLANAASFVAGFVVGIS